MAKRTKHNRILALIEAIEKSFQGASQVYTEGSCYKLYLILKEVFPEAESWCDYDQSHVVTVIDDRAYDITGEVYIDKENWYKLDESGGSASKWIFSIYDVNVECPNCDELFFRGELEKESINTTKQRYEQNIVI